MKRLILVSLVYSIIGIPFVVLVILSFAGRWLFPDLLPDFWTLNNWRVLLSGSYQIGSSMMLSIFISVSVAGFSTFGGFITAKIIRQHRLESPFLVFTYMPYLLAPVIYAAIIYYYFIVFGIAGSVLGVWVGQLLITYPFAIIFFSRYWTQAMVNLDNLAKTLGSSRFQSWMLVLIPAGRGLLTVCFFQTFLISWFEYGMTQLIGVGQVQTLTLRVFQFVQEANPYMAALSGVLLFIPPLILLAVNKQVLERNFNEGQPV